MIRGDFGHSAAAMTSLVVSSKRWLTRFHHSRLNRQMYWTSCSIHSQHHNTTRSRTSSCVRGQRILSTTQFAALLICMRTPVVLTLVIQRGEMETVMRPSVERHCRELLLLFLMDCGRISRHKLSDSKHLGRSDMLITAAG